MDDETKGMLLADEIEALIEMDDETKCMLLADAIETSIESEKTILRLKRLVWFMFFVNVALAIIIIA